jgi:hypothetical protein
MLSSLTPCGPTFFTESVPVYFPRTVRIDNEMDVMSYVHLHSAVEFISLIKILRRILFDINGLDGLHFLGNLWQMVAKCGLLSIGV